MPSLGLPASRPWLQTVDDWLRTVLAPAPVDTGAVPTSEICQAKTGVPDQRQDIQWIIDKAVLKFLVRISKQNLLAQFAHFLNKHFVQCIIVHLVACIDIPNVSPLMNHLISEHQLLHANVWLRIEQPQAPWQTSSANLRNLRNSLHKQSYKRNRLCSTHRYALSKELFPALYGFVANSQSAGDASWLEHQNAHVWKTNKNQDSYHLRLESHNVAALILKLSWGKVHQRIEI